MTDRQTMSGKQTRSSCPAIQTGLKCAANNWYAERLGRGIPYPFRASRDEIDSYSCDRARLMWGEFWEFGLGRADPQPGVSVPQHDGRQIAAVAYGAKAPIWDETTGAFWMEDRSPLWAALECPADVDALAIPDWADNPLVQENVHAWERVCREVGTETARELSLGWTETCFTHPATGQRYRFSNFPTFLDLGTSLMGATRFFEVLAANEELAHALVRKCFEVSASYADFMSRLYDRPRKGWASLGGDNSCLVSPQMYRAYAMSFDTLVREKCGNVPRNLHSCGASSHLYDVWAEYPEREQIVYAQTRAIPGAMSGLRKALPSTYVNLTIHQPQVDFEREDPERIRALVWELAEVMEFRDTCIKVIFSTVDEQCKRNLRAFLKAAEEVNERVH